MSAPVPVNVVATPEQEEGEFTLTFGNSFTVTIPVAVFEHPFVVPVTV